MREPFISIPYNKEVYVSKHVFSNLTAGQMTTREQAIELVHDPNDDNPMVIAPNFRVSMLSSCYWNYLRQFHRYVNVKPPLPISSELNEIFDIGTKIHYQEEVLNKGAKRVIHQEEAIRIMHEEKKYTLSRHADVEEFDFKGVFLRDFKTASHQKHDPNESKVTNRINWKDAFFWFLLNPNSPDYKLQLSSYSYTGYIAGKPYINDGVITKIDKVNPRNRLSLELDLYTLDEIRDKIENHPVILCVMGEITIPNLIDLAMVKNRQYVNKNGRCYKCINCAYNQPTECPVREKI